MPEVTGFENQLYCDFSQSATKAVAGKNILLAQTVDKRRLELVI
ncbi:hypothetical protein [Enterococcus avium]